MEKLVSLCHAYESEVSCNGNARKLEVKCNYVKIQEGTGIRKSSGASSLSHRSRRYNQLLTPMSVESQDVSIVSRSSVRNVVIV